MNLYARDVFGAMTGRPPMLANARMGQLLPFPVSGTGATPTGGTEMKCYRCGVSPPRLMLPSMASFNPSCVLVDDAECAEQAAEIEQAIAEGGGAFDGMPAPAPGLDGPTLVILTVFNPETLDGIPGAQVKVSLVDIRTMEVTPGMGEGQTDAEGKFRFERQAPPRNTLYRWRLDVTTGNAPVSFPAEQVDVPARTAVAANRMTGQLEAFTPNVMVCPTGSSTIVCDVAKAQTFFVQVYEQQLFAWHHGGGGAPGDAKIEGFAADQAHMAAMNGIRPRDPQLARFWIGIYSYWIGVLDIPPGDWPTMLDRFEQALAIFSKIPFPPIEDYFVRCARGIPLYKGYSFGNPKLYSPTFSDYFPREDYRIEADMAYAYLVNFGAILQCIEHKIQQKIKEIRRSAKAWRTMGLIATIVLAPLAGGAAPTLMATEIGSYMYESITQRESPEEIKAVVTSGVAIASSNPEALETLIREGMNLLLADATADLDPIVQQIVNAAVPKIAAAGVSDALNLGVGGGAGGAMDVTSLQAIGSAAVAVGIQLVGNMITAQGAEGLEGLERAVLGLQNLETLMVPFVAWAIETLLLGALFDAAAQGVTDGTIEPIEGITLPTDGVPTDGVLPEGVPEDVPGVPPDGVPGVPPEGVPTGTLLACLRPTGAYDLLDPVTLQVMQANVAEAQLPANAQIVDVGDTRCVPGAAPPGDGVPITPLPPDDVPESIVDFDFQEDVIDPLVDQAEEEGVTVPPEATEPHVPIVDETALEAGNLAALTGVGALGIVGALIATGVLGS